MTVIKAEEAGPWESTCLSTFKEDLSSKPQYRGRGKVRETTHRPQNTRLSSIATKPYRADWGAKGLWTGEALIRHVPYLLRPKEDVGRKGVCK